MLVVAVLDLLFAYSFIGLMLALLVTGARIVLMSNDPAIVWWSTVLLVSGTATGAVAYLWSFTSVGRVPVPSRRLNWRHIIRQYPVLIGPAAYYLGEYRPSTAKRSSWFTDIRENRRLLDLVASVAWRGTIVGYGLLIGGLVAAVAQSSFLFISVLALFVAVFAFVGAAFFVLSIVVLVHAAIGDPGSSMARLNAVPRVRPLWVRGFRQYYQKMIRPTLIKSENRSH